MNRLSITLLSLTAFAAPLWVPVAAGAGTNSATRCTFSGADAAIDPGLTTSPHSQTFHNTKQGTITCDGPVLGRRPTGPGTWITNAGSAQGTCTGGKGEYTQTFRFPTHDGDITLTVKGPFTFGPLKGGLIGGELHGDRMTGSFRATPTEGNCLTGPLTEVDLDEQGTLLD